MNIKQNLESYFQTNKKHLIIDYVAVFFLFFILKYLSVNNILNLNGSTILIIIFAPITGITINKINSNNKNKENSNMDYLIIERIVPIFLVIITSALYYLINSVIFDPVKPGLMILAIIIFTIMIYGLFIVFDIMYRLKDEGTLKQILFSALFIVIGAPVIALLLYFIYNSLNGVNENIKDILLITWLIILTITFITSSFYTLKKYRYNISY